MTTVETRHSWTGRNCYVLATLTLVYALNIADRTLLATLIQPIKAEFSLSDGGVAFLTSSALAIFYITAGIPLGVLADRTNRRNMISLAVAAWSLCTLACGMAASYWQLLAGRIGVGVGEAGGTPPSQALLADEFQPAARSTAMSIYSLGSVMGSALGAAVGGWLADRYGWRHTLVLFGLIGIPLALLIRTTLREPRRGAADGVASSNEAMPHFGIAATLAFLRTHKSIFHVLIGGTIVTFAGGGLLWWTPAFLTRSHGFSVGESGGLLGLMLGIGGPIVMVGTAWSMARLVRRDVRWQLWFVAIATCIMALTAVLAFWSPSRATAVAALWIFVPVTFLYIGPTLALFQSLIPAPMRGQAVAVFLFTANVANLVLAPQLVGWLSDLLGSRLSQPGDSLRWVLGVGALTGFWGAWHYLVAARTLATDLEKSAQPLPAGAMDLVTTSSAALPPRTA